MSTDSFKIQLEQSVFFKQTKTVVQLCFLKQINIRKALQKSPPDHKTKNRPTCQPVQKSSKYKGFRNFFALRRDPSNPFISIFYCFQKFWKLHKCWEKWISWWSGICFRGSVFGQKVDRSKCLQSHLIIKRMISVGSKAAEIIRFPNTFYD